MPLLPAGPAKAGPSGPSGQSGLAAPGAEPWRQLAAACGALAVVAEVAVAPVTLAGTVIALGIARLTRWSPAWLALPALTGAGWAVLQGPGPAAAGFAAGSAHLVVFLAAPGDLPSRLARLPEVIMWWRACLAGQLPLALVTAAAQAAAVGELRGRSRPDGSRGRPDAANGRRYRPGLVSAARRAYLTAMLRRGEVATVDGACLGIGRVTGRPAAVSWAEAAGGVVVTGLDSEAVTRSGLDLAVAAIQHRKAVIIVDLGDHPGQVEAAVAAACSDRRAPLRTLSPASGRARGGAEDAEPIGVAEVLARRHVLLARPESGAAEAAAGLTRLVAGELAEALAERHALGVPADVLAWINGCELADREDLSALLAPGREAGAVIVLGTSAGPVAARLAGQAAVVAVRGRPPRDWPAAGRAPSDAETDPAVPPAADRAQDQDVPALILNGRRADDLSLLVRAPAPRLLTGYRAVR